MSLFQPFFFCFFFCLSIYLSTCYIQFKPHAQVPPYPYPHFAVSVSGHQRLTKLTAWWNTWIFSKMMIILHIMTKSFRKINKCLFKPRRPQVPDDVRHPNYNLMMTLSHHFLRMLYECTIYLNNCYSDSWSLCAQCVFACKLNVAGDDCFAIQNKPTSSSSIASNNSASTWRMKSFSNTLITLCSCLNKKSTSTKALPGILLISVWICKRQSIFWRR